MAAFVPGRQGITEAEVAAWVADLRELGAADNYFFSLNRYLFLARNPWAIVGPEGAPPAVPEFGAGGTAALPFSDAHIGPSRL